MPHTIVVVDDDRPILDVVCDVLTYHGMSAISCLGGQKALDCIRNHQPHLVILDLQMPVVDGVAVFEAMRAEPQTAAIPVLFLTANAHILRQRLPTYSSLGAALISKPFKVPTLLSMVKQLVSAT